MYVSLAQRTQMGSEIKGAASVLHHYYNKEREISLAGANIIIVTVSLSCGMMLAGALVLHVHFQTPT